MGFGKSSNVKQKPKIEPATPIDGRWSDKKIFTLELKSIRI